MEKVTTDKLLQDLGVVIQDAEALLQATAGQTGEKISEIRGRAEASLRHARERMAEAGVEVQEKAKAVAKSADTYVHENPWTSIAIAAGIGFLIGTLTSRR
jgi:ElaB/YqjD/DUF883 family membrane-anchored ribosome-binding protein